MKKTFTLKPVLLVCAMMAVFMAYAQVPQKFPYQAVARDISGNVLANQNVGIRFSILNGSNAGPVVYQETQTATTNKLGLCTANVGEGTIVSGTFTGVNWGSGSKFIKVEIDPTGGTSYTVTGTTELMSVPYALYASNGTPGATGAQGPAGTLSPGSAAGNTSYWDGSQWVLNSANIYNNGGNVGIGVANPTSAKLEIGGTTKTTNFQMTSGAAASTLLAGDATGQATWTTTTSILAPLNTALNNEITRAQVTETSIASNISSETAARQAADASLTANISALTSTVSANQTATTAALNTKWSLTGNAGTTPSVAAIGSAITAGSNFIGTADAKDLVIATNNGTSTFERLRVSSSTGNVGIGTVAPGAKLEVAGTTKTTNLQMTNGAAANYVLKSDATGNASWAPNVTATYGESFLSSPYTLTTAFAASGLTVTLPAAGTYRLSYHLHLNFQSSGPIIVRLYDVTNAVMVPNSLTYSFQPNSGAGLHVSTEVFVTVTAPTTIKLEAQGGATGMIYGDANTSNTRSRLNFLRVN